MGQQHWENYYRRGALATAPMDGEGGFDQELAVVWKNFFSPLPRGAKVLDIGTGNGIVLAFASSLAVQLSKGWQLYGTDLARIDPLQDVPQSKRRFVNCQFFPGVATESLPFEPQFFDAVTGHYALEYAQEQAALSEIARVLKPGGVCQFLIHHQGSILVENATRTLSSAHYILDVLKLYDKLLTFAKMPDGQAGVNSPQTIALQSAVRQLKQRCAAGSNTDDGHLLAVIAETVTELLKRRVHSSAMQSAQDIEHAQSDLLFAVSRLKDLLAVAKSEHDLLRLRTVAEGLGLICSEMEPQFHAGNVLVGWRLRFTAQSGCA